MVAAIGQGRTRRYKTIRTLRPLGVIFYAESRYPLPQGERTCYATPIFLNRRTKQLTDRRNPGTREHQMQNLQINPQRLWDTLMETAQIGATAKGGICRLTLTDLDRQVRDWFKAQCEALGCTVAVDEVGNMFARRPGKKENLAPIAMGSHLDTQPTGGKFDGTLGVLGALEAMRTLHETGYETNAPIEIVNWTNEEGSRFAPAMLASGVFAGVFTPDFA